MTEITAEIVYGRTNMGIKLLPGFEILGARQTVKSNGWYNWGKEVEALHLMRN